MKFLRNAAVDDHQLVGSMNRTRVLLGVDLVAVFAAVAWFWFLLSNAVLEAGFSGIALGIALYALTCIGLVKLMRQHAHISTLALCICIAVAGLFAATLFGTLIGTLPFPKLPSGSPLFLRRASFLVPGLTATVITTAALLPLTAFLGTVAAWIVPLLAGAIALALEYESLIEPIENPFARFVTVFELLLILIVVPLLLRWLGPVVRVRLRPGHQ